MIRGPSLALGLALVACADDRPLGDDRLASPREAVDLDPDPHVVHVALRAAPVRVTIAGREVDALAWNGQVPGPTLRARVGDTIIVDIDNAMDLPTTVHWHGMHVPWEVDGATWKMDPIAPGTTRRVTFVADHAGTFWYHPHFDSDREVDLGLYGAFVVAPIDDATEGADERVLVFDTWAERSAPGPANDDGAHRHGGVDDRTRAWVVNGLDDPRWVARPDTLLHARLVNASTTGYLALGGDSGFTVIATDQGPTARLSRPDRLVLAPGDRAEVVWMIGTQGFDVVAERFSMHGGALAGPDADHHDARLFRIDVEGARSTRPPPVLVASGAAPTPDPGTTDVLWTLQGSELGWLINGESFPDVTIPTVTLGADVVIEVRNLSPTRHPFHLHGMAFEVLSQDGLAPASRTLEDTIDIPIASRVRLLVRADNPGEWMAHCHILPHAHGMMTVLRVAPP